ncbi:MAG: NUDIX domain-containing protein [Candidatus Cloacimonetes bacterium]|nr:NUDIX domain-containing protein [Candidatus Cloacimonadota bacterium]
MRKIRNSVKAVIIENNELLTIRCEDKNGVFYMLPGGGQQLYELMPEALARECREEINCEVVVGKLLFIREYRSDNHEFAEEDDSVHQIDFMFRCSLKKGSVPGIGSLPDPYQTGVEWLDISRLMEYRFYPLTLREYIMDKSKTDYIYMGDIN